jgi:ligand-binding sensor domain-containing protein
MDKTIMVGNNNNTLFFLETGRLKDTHHEQIFQDNSRVVETWKADKHNKLWMGTDNGVCIYNPENQKISVLLNLMPV